MGSETEVLQNISGTQKIKLNIIKAVRYTSQRKQILS